MSGMATIIHESFAYSVCSKVVAASIFHFIVFLYFVSKTQLNDYYLVKLFQIFFCFVFTEEHKNAHTRLSVLVVDSLLARSATHTKTHRV